MINRKASLPKSTCYLDLPALCGSVNQGKQLGSVYRAHTLLAKPYSRYSHNRLYLTKPYGLERNFVEKSALLKVLIVRYRPDIDGLRAIAVCIVIFFHFGIPGFSGGFIGVDVFFVLSGYLIASIILQQLKEQRFSFINFYFRRIRRLFPVFVVVMLCTTLVAYQLMLPSDFREFGQSLIASTVYLSNLLFYWEAGYFDTASHLKPLLHTWSLSVEEQFYIVFPLLAWLVYRFLKRGLVLIFIALTGISLLAAQWYLQQDANAVFYLYPFRAWEMFIGVCLASHRLPPLPSSKINSCIGLIGLSMIAIPSIAYSKATVFPGFSALLPCLGTCLIIYSGQQYAGVVQRALSHPVPVFIGKISYSLYLWHWPVFVLYMYDKAGSPSAYDVLIMGSITLLASVIGWKLIEKPFREGKAPCSKKALPVFVATGLSSALLIGLGYWFHISNGLPSRFDPQTAEFAKAANDLFGDLSGCQEMDNTALPNIKFCPIGQALQADSYTVIWADSHGAAYKRGFEEASMQDKPALLAWKGGCPPLMGIAKDESVSSLSVDAECSIRNAALMQHLESDNRINAVVLVGRWSYYLNQGGVGIDKQYRIDVWPEGQQKPSPWGPEKQSAFVVDAFNKTVERLRQLGLRVFVVEQPPEFAQYQARLVALGLIKNNLSDTLTDITSTSYQSVQDRQGPIQDAMQKAVDKGLITLIKTHHYFCTENTCSALIEGMPIYFDNNHVSSKGAAIINTMFAPLMDYLEQR